RCTCGGGNSHPGSPQVRASCNSELMNNPGLVQVKKKSSASIPFYVTVLFIICLVTLGGTAISNYQNLQKLKQNNDWMEHGWSVKDHLKNINLLIMDAESSMRGYYLSDDPTYLRP